MSTKTCPKCGSKHLILLRSQHVKLCSDCRTKIKWQLDKGQKPLLANR